MQSELMLHKGLHKSLWTSLQALPLAHTCQLASLQFSADPEAQCNSNEMAKGLAG